MHILFLESMAGIPYIMSFLHDEAYLDTLDPISDIPKA